MDTANVRLQCTRSSDATWKASSLTWVAIILCMDPSWKLPRNIRSMHHSYRWLGYPARICNGHASVYTNTGFCGHPGLQEQRQISLLGLPCPLPHLHLHAFFGSLIARSLYMPLPYRSASDYFFFSFLFILVSSLNSFILLLSSRFTSHILLTQLSFSGDSYRVYHTNVCCSQDL